MSDYGKAMPLQYGRCRVVGNLIWYADFTPIKRTDPTPNADRHDFSPKPPRKPT